jgi:type I restriction enzyme S subunit
MENNLPNGWAECSIGEILLAKKGKKPSTVIDEPRQGYVPYILIDEMEGKSIRTYTNDPKVSIIDESEVLLVWDGSIGKCGSGMSGAIGSTLVGLKPLDEIPTKFLEYIVKQQNNFIKETSTGSGLQHINKDFFEICKISLPPLLEQHRIVAKVHSVKQKIESNNYRLEKLPKLLTRFRQSVLASAFCGRLTENWREKNSENSQDLIQQIKEIRIKRYEVACKTAKKEGKRKPKEYDNYDVILRDDFDLFEIPESWRWVDFRFVMSECEPFCYGVVQPEGESTDGNYLIRAGDIKNNSIDTSSLRTISKSVDAEFSRSRVKGGEILITVVGAGIGESGIVPISCKGYNIARAVAKVPIKDFSSKYILHWLNNSIAMKWMKTEAREVARPTLNLEQLRTIPLPLPPLGEQNEIVKRIEQLFVFADKLEARYTKAKTMIDKLPQSILAKAFRGELVPQNPNDEPASVLLERIKKEKEKLNGEKKVNRKESIA